MMQMRCDGGNSVSKSDKKKRKRGLEDRSQSGMYTVMFNASHQYTCCVCASVCYWFRECKWNWQ